MNLYQLTRSIDPIIMDRGRDYVLGGNVLSIEDIGNKVYRAVVEGSQLYEVYVALDDGGTVLSSECDCPYDYGLAGDTSSNNYFDERVALMRYHLIRIYDGNDQARDFLSRHLYFSGFREMAIRDALQNDCYEEVIRLAEEGEAHDQAKGLPGLVLQWKKYRYEAYSHSRQIELQRKLGIELILDGDFSYYKQVKNIYPTDEWTLVYGNMLQRLEKNQWPGKIYTLILVEEKEYTRLLAHIKKQHSSIEEFHSLLYPHYPQEVKTLFLAYIETKADRSANRKDYADVCRIIHMLQKAGGKEEALQVVRLLLAKYPKKPAFQDELMKI